MEHPCPDRACCSGFCMFHHLLVVTLKRNMSALSLPSFNAPPMIMMESLNVTAQ